MKCSIFMESSVPNSAYRKLAVFWYLSYLVSSGCSDADILITRATLRERFRSTRGLAAGWLQCAQSIRVAGQRDEKWMGIYTESARRPTEVNLGRLVYENSHGQFCFFFRDSKSLDDCQRTQL